jgi:hypothetical protein
MKLRCLEVHPESRKDEAERVWTSHAFFHGDGVNQVVQKSCHKKHKYKFVSAYLVAVSVWVGEPMLW